MGLDGADRNWLDGKFEQIHGRITEVKVTMAEHIAEPCKDLVKHEEKHHNPAVFWGMLASIAAVSAAVAGAFVWFMNITRT
jgi:hypothetical protein